MIPHRDHHAFNGRGAVAGHLAHVHEWTDELAMRDGNGHFLSPDSELLAVHRELHALEPQFIITNWPEGKRK